MGDFFLIGPTTGIAGIFRGPFYYYLITPFYWFGGGNPVWPAVFLATTTVFAIAVVYFLGKEFHSRKAGLIAAFLAAGSFFLMLTGRWLSNPTPMMLLSVLLVYFLYQITKGVQWAWIAVSLVAGLSLFHFRSSGEFFYFPALFVFTVWQRKNWPNAKIIFISVLVFAFTASPLILFDPRNNGLLSSNIADFLFKESAFQTSFSEILISRLELYKSVIAGKLFPGPSSLTESLLVLLTITFVLFIPKLVRHDGRKILLLLAGSPLIGFLFFRGNAVYDYYFTGYYFIYTLLIAIVLAMIGKSLVGKLFVLAFLFLFWQNNWPIISSNINDNVDGPQTIALGNQLRATEWVFENANGREFNVDAYVPPVIPHAYDYLFLWQSNTSRYKNGGYTLEQRRDLLYTLYEVDPPHPERLEAWLSRQDGLGVVEEEARIGGITVQKRMRVETHEF